MTVIFIATLSFFVFSQLLFVVLVVPISKSYAVTRPNHQQRDTSTVAHHELNSHTLDATYSSHRFHHGPSLFSHSMCTSREQHSMPSCCNGTIGQSLVLDCLSSHRVSACVMPHIVIDGRIQTHFGVHTLCSMITHSNTTSSNGKRRNNKTFPRSSESFLFPF